MPEGAEPLFLRVSALLDGSGGLVEGALQARGLFACVPECLPGLLELLELLVEPDQVGFQVRDPVLMCVEQLLGLLALSLGGGVVRFGVPKASVLHGSALFKGPVDFGSASGGRCAALCGLARRRIAGWLGLSNDARLSAVR